MEETSGKFSEKALWRNRSLGVGLVSLSTKELENISLEIRNFEPFVSLDGGEDGLNFYREFAKKIPQNIKDKKTTLIKTGIFSAIAACWGVILVGTFLTFK